MEQREEFIKKKTSVTTSPHTQTQKKKNSLDKNPLKITLKNCDRVAKV